MDKPSDVDGNRWPNLAVGAEIDHIGIAPFTFARVFNPKDASVFSVGAALGEFILDELSAFGF